MFLALTGLMALVTGGIGVSNAVRVFIAERMRSIAIFKTLGAPSALLLKIYGLHIGVIAASAVAIGAGVGSIVPSLLSHVAQDVFPIRVPEGFCRWLHLRRRASTGSWLRPYLRHGRWERVRM